MKNCKNFYSNWMFSTNPSSLPMTSLQQSNVPWCDSLQREKTRRNSHPGLQHTFQTHQHFPVCARELLSPSRRQKRNRHRRMSLLPEKHKQQGSVWETKRQPTGTPTKPRIPAKKRLMDITYDSRSEHLRDKGRRKKKPIFVKNYSHYLLHVAMGLPTVQLSKGFPD